MSETSIAIIITAFLAALPPTILAIATLRGTQRNEKKVAEVAQVAMDTSVKADVIIGKADQIHTLTNSNLNAVTKALEVANQKITDLERMLATIIEKKNGGTAADHVEATKL